MLRELYLSYCLWADSADMPEALRRVNVLRALLYGSALIYGIKVLLSSLV